MAWLVNFVQILLFVAAAPLLAGWIKKLKCWSQNRRAPSILQPYRDLAKLFRKETVVAERASWIFRLAPTSFSQWRSWLQASFRWWRCTCLPPPWRT